MKYILAFVFLVFVACDSANISRNQLDDKNADKVIYGSDDRLDIYEINNPQLVELARSTALVVDDDELIPLENGKIKIVNSLCRTIKNAH